MANKLLTFSGAHKRITGTDKATHRMSIWQLSQRLFRHCHQFLVGFKGGGLASHLANFITKCSHIRIVMAHFA
ncbi:Uncharacterised protein [Vibrio cholerae]|nr:Uncharacterised protein [Vibrio cholerae]